MMKKLLIVAVMSLLVGCGLKGTNENGNVDAQMETFGGGKACVEGDPGGIHLCDNITEGNWEIRNLANTATHLTCTVVESKFIFIDQYYLRAQASESVPDTGMKNGDYVECEMWFGYFEGPINRIFQNSPNLKCSFTYSHTSLMKSACKDNNVARISLPLVKGVAGTMASSYGIDPTNHTFIGLEEGTKIAVVNGSSDWVDYEVYSTQSTSETDVRVATFQMCSVGMYFDEEDVCELNGAINQGTILVLVVRAHDVNYDSWSWTDYEIVKIDLLKQEAKVLDKSALHGGLP